MNENFAALQKIIATRRTIKPQQMNGQKIPDEQISNVIDLANFAPSHGLTEPWRFVVYSEKNVADFCHSHALMYKMNVSSEKFDQGAIQNILLGATTLGIATYWGSGGMTRHKALKDFLKINEPDEVMGILYLGYSDKKLSYNRATTASEKTHWNP